MTTLVLRTLTNVGDTTKGTPLTNAEIDTNFIALKTGSTSSVNVTGGTINGTSIGATSRSSGAFTTLTANGATTLTSTTASTSKTTGALVVTGGVGVGGRVTANDFVGDGSAVTNINANSISSGTLSVTRGGTGSSELTGVLIGNGTSAVTTKANPSGNFVGTSDAQTLTNKTISYANNTLTGVQPTLVSGTNIKTINGDTILGSGNIVTTPQVTNDVSTNTTYYPTLSVASSGQLNEATVSTTKLTFNPSTGTLSATNHNSLSDRNKKTNITSITNATDVVSLLDGVSFNWIDTGAGSYGVVAQELEKVLPELVEGTDVKTVNYSGIIAFLINAIKELDCRLKVLESNK